MKLYPEIPVTMHIQSFGKNACFIVLKFVGEKIDDAKSDIESIFNELYNKGATYDGTELKPTEVEFHDHNNTIATFWTTPSKMMQFFAWRRFHANWVDFVVDLEIDLENRLRRDDNRTKGKFKGGFKNHPDHMAAMDEIATDCYYNGYLDFIEFKEQYPITFNPWKVEPCAFGEDFGMAHTIRAERPDDNHRESIANGSTYRETDAKAD